MSENLSIKITAAGKAAAFNAANTGFELEISQVALGDEAWSPVDEDGATKLRSEKLRVPITAGERIGSSQIHLTAKADGPDSFHIREVGFFLNDALKDEDKTLFGVYSTTTQDLAYKTAGTELILDFDLILSTLPPTSVNVISTGESGFHPSFINQLIPITLGNIKTATVQVGSLIRYLKTVF
jgi:hypothetical protein